MTLLESHFPDPLTGFAFARDYIAGVPKARSFFGTMPEDLNGAAEVRRGQPSLPWGKDDLRELAAFNRECGNNPGAELVGRLADPAALVVITGQQPNLLASPFYVLLKALTAVAVARRFAESSGVPVVPMFWVASDDHDFSELRECWVADGSGHLENLGVLVGRGGGVSAGSPAYMWNLDPSSAKLREAITRILGSEGSSAARETLACLESALQAPANFENVFCRLLAAYMKDFPIVFIAPRLQSVRRKQVGFLARSIGMNDLSETVNAAADELELQGYKAQLRRPARLLNFFMLVDGVRCRLTRQGSEITAQSDGRTLMTFDEDRLRSMLDETPELFSANVVTRPIVQDAILPTIAYIAGPGEVAYLAQLGKAYEALGVARSAIVPRAFNTTVDARTAAHLEKTGAAPSGDTAVVRAMERVEELRVRTLVDLRAVESEPEALGDHVAKAFDKTYEAIEFSFLKLRDRLARQAEQRGGQDSVRAGNLLQPTGHAQERVLSPLSFGAWITPSDLARAIYTQRDWANPRPQVTRIE